MSSIKCKVEVSYAAAKAMLGRMRINVSTQYFLNLETCFKILTVRMYREVILQTHKIQLSSKEVLGYTFGIVPY